MLVLDFAQSGKQNIQTFKINEGDLHHEIHSGYCDGKSGAASIVPHVWYFHLNILGIDFMDEITKFKLFGATLMANAKARWLTVYERALHSSAHGDEISFDFAVRDFIAKYCDESSRDTQLQYVRRVCKPRRSQMSVHDFQMYLENCNQVADWMPSTSPIFTDDALKRVFVQAMPDT